MAKHIVSLLIFTVFFLPYGCLAQARARPAPRADTAIRFADSIFARPEFHFQHVEPDLPPNIQDILIRFNNALVANRQWFMDYKKAYEGRPLPYNERFGISINDYVKLQNLEKAPPQLTPVDTQKITVIRNADLIHFQSEGNIHLLEYLQIDRKNLLLIYGGDTIPLLGRTVMGPTSPYGQWQGFTWRMEKVDTAGSVSSGGVTARVIEINLGLTDPGRKPFLRIKYQSLREGATTANLELTGFIY